MKNRGELPLGFLAATVFWLGVVAWGTSYAPSNPQKDACYQAAAKSGRSTSECETFWEKTTSEPVALFTLVLAFSTIGLWVATGGLYVAGKDAIRETRRIGEAQVRAYVHIKFIALDFVFDAICPRISFIAANTGQSPARNFIWNMTLQYAGSGISREAVLNKNWLTDPPGVGIAAASESSPDAAVIPDMAIKQYVIPKASECVARLKIEYRFTDVFDRDWSGEAYFAGVINKNQLSAEGFQIGMDGKITSQRWSGRLSPMPRPRDWDEIRKAQTA